MVNSTGHPNAAANAPSPTGPCQSSAIELGEREQRIVTAYEAEEQRRITYRRRAWLKSSGLPLRHLAKSRAVLDLPDLAWRATLDRLTAAGRDHLFAIVGPRGIGKTQLATCIGVDAVEHDRSVKYATLADLTASVREAFGTADKRPTEAAAVAAFTASALLIVDEINEGNCSDFTGRTLTRIVDARYAAMRATLLLSNHKPDDLCAAVGPSITDRLREAGGIIDGSAWPPMRGSAAVIPPDPTVISWLEARP